MRFDRTAWLQELADRHGRMLFGAAYRVLGNADEAEDVLQDVFLKLLAIKARPEMAGEWGAYLRTMAVRRAIDQLRGRRRRDWRREELNEEIAVSREPSPGRVAQRNEQAGLLRRALSKLPEREAAVFALRTFEEESCEAIAGQLGMNSGQVRVMLHRTRRRLVEILAPYTSNDLSKDNGHERQTTQPRPTRR